MPEQAHIILPFADSTNETICAIGHGNCALLKELANYLRLPLQSGECPNSTVIISEDAPSADDGWSEWPGVVRFNGAIHWKPDEFRFHFHLPVAKRYALIPIIRRAFNLACLRRTLFGKTIVVHGTLLTFPETNDAAVLFGHSGIGKSTASERFTRQGGSYLSDDKMLITILDDNRIIAQPTPTWSRFGVRDLDVEFSHVVPAKSMLWLSRGEDDTIHPADPVQWRLTLVKSFSNVLEYPCNWLPNELIGKLMDKNMSYMQLLVSHFGTYKLLGDLKGNIYDNLKAFKAAGPQTLDF